MPQNTQILTQFDNARFGKFHVTLLTLTGLCWLLAAYGVTIIGFMLPALRDEWQLSSSALGLIASMGMLGMLIGSITAGILADRFGRRSILVWTLLYLGIVFAISAAAWDYTSLLVLRLFTGIGLGAIVPVSSTLITEFSPARYRGTLSVITNISWGLGGTLAALAGYTLVLAHGWRTALLIGSLTLILSPLVRLLLPESMRFLLGKGRLEEAQREFSRIHLQPAAQPVSPGAGAAPQPASIDNQSDGMWSKDFARTTLSLWFFWFAVNFLYQAAFVWLPSLLAATQVSEGQSFLLTMLISLGQVPGALIVAFLTDRGSRRNLIITSLVLLSTITFLFGLSQSDTWVLVTGFLLMVFNGMTWSMAYPFSSELYPTRMRGSATGWATGIGRAGGVIAPIAVGWVVQAGGSIFNVFTLLAAAPFLAALAILSIKRETTGRSLEDIAS